MAPGGVPFVEDDAADDADDNETRRDGSEYAQSAMRMIDGTIHYRAIAIYRMIHHR